MDTVLYSWLAAAAVAPFVVILSCWTLAVFRTYRPDWRLVDIFLYALTCLEVASALFSFGYAVLGAIKPDLDAPCRFLVWGLTATRIFHLSTVTSLLLDRALASRWPGKYRSSVRQSQVRYHIIVLGIISVFVGVTSVFARLPDPPTTCSLHPLDWDVKFSAFLACVYGMLLLTGFGCCLVVQAGRFRSRGIYRTQSCSRDSATSNSSASCDENRDLEWAVVASICWLSYLVNHGPFLVLSTLGMVVPTFWSPWMDNSVVWLRLAQGLLVPCVLLMADMPHRSALRNMLRQSGRVYRHLSDHGGFRMQIGEVKKPPFPIYPPYHVAPFPQRLRWNPTNLPSLQSLQPLDADTLRKGGYGSAGYTTLLSLTSSSSTAFSSPYSSCSSMGQSMNSVTTNAVNDFVFRRPSVLALFEPSRQKTDANKRCDTPTPFSEDVYETICNCDVDEDRRRASREAACKCNYGKASREVVCKCNFAMASREDLCKCNFGTTSSGDVCNCDHQGKRSLPRKEICICGPQVGRKKGEERKSISKNMINIILAYENSGLDVTASGEMDIVDDEDRSVSSSSSESSDADSVQSVIIRQRVDQKGRVSASDISRVEKKLFRCDKDSSEKEVADNVVSEQRIVYSEYL